MNYKKPIVSVICHCYNHSKFVVETLKSVLNQCYREIEIIVVDDFSQDDSVTTISNFISNYPEVIFIRNSKNLGLTKSFNNAIKSAKGSYFIDLAADDILLPNCVKLQIEGFKNTAYENIGIVYGNIALLKENGEFGSYFYEVDPFKKVIQKRPTGLIYDKIITSGKSYCSVSAMIKREVFDTLGGYDENLEYEDFDFWVRLSRNFEIDFIDEILMNKRIVTDSLETFFFKKNNLRAHKINYSTYLILIKIIKLNISKNEDLALQKKIHYEIVNSIKVRDFELIFKNIWLRIWLEYRKRFKNFTIFEAMQN